MENKPNNFQNLIIKLLSNLSDREQEILKHRYHLTLDLERRATLKQIGDIYNITRERVRQLEKEALLKLAEIKKSEEFAGEIRAVEMKLINYLEMKGGIVRQDHLISEHIENNYEFDYIHPNAFLFSMEYLFEAIEKVENHDKFYPSWKIIHLQLDHVADFLHRIEAELGAKNSVVKHDEFLELAKKNLPATLENQLMKYKENNQLDIERFIQSYLEAASRLEKNILSEWGLVHWQRIRPKKLGDKILLIFEKESKPLHFRDIAQRINEAKFDRKNICPATVHNELISNEKYVLIGRGIYALKDWGYSTGTVADIITHVLQETDRALSKEEIFDAVLKQRQVNKSTIYLTLINKEQFKKDEHGRFSLKD
jgi:DNA-binding CsgD family transcriptional regulator